MTLEYLREYCTYFHISKSCELSESNTYKIIRWIEDELMKSKKSICGFHASDLLQFKATDHLNFTASIFKLRIGVPKIRGKHIKVLKNRIKTANSAKFCRVLSVIKKF